ncbi:MAG TPA: response regulator [Kofleriaceae bacterium]|nr:response regulator [Kofleriaceae bacterium]
MSPSAGRYTALVIHGDGDVLDTLTQWLEANGFDVVAAPSGFRAQAHLEGDRPVEVVIAPWDDTHPVGGEIYHWVLKNRPDLRSRFVFIANDVPPEFDAVVGGRCLAVPLAAIEEVIRVASGIVKRVRTPPRGVPIMFRPGRPGLLLVEDDPLLLTAMADLFSEQGYSVSQVDSLKNALELVEFKDFDVIVADWKMHDGSAATLYKWITKNKPHLAARIVFLSEADLDDSGPIAPGRPMFRKGQDSQALSETLRQIVAQVRGS